MNYLLQAVSDDGVGVAVEFSWSGDRFGHSVYLIDGQSRQLVATSCEGTPDEDWPASPPVQEIHQQGDVLFLTGMAGHEYWSASVSAGGNGFEFDWACRLKTPAPNLAHAYELADDVEAGSQASILRVTGRELSLSPLPTAWQREANLLTCRWTDDAQPPATVRWSLAWKLIG